MSTGLWLTETDPLTEIRIVWPALPSVMGCLSHGVDPIIQSHFKHSPLNQALITIRENDLERASIKKTGVQERRHLSPRQACSADGSVEPSRGIYFVIQRL